MSHPVTKGSGVVNLTAEIEIRRRLGEAFDQVVETFAVPHGLEVRSPTEVDLLASLLAETIEVRKRAEKEEKALKARLREYFLGDIKVLDLPSVLVWVESVTRTDLDRAALVKDIPDVMERYGKQTVYEKMQLKRKAV